MKKKSVYYRYLKEIVYGGSDGIVTTFAVVAGFNGANATIGELPYFIVLLFGLANLFGDAASMGIGNFLSQRAEDKKNKKKSNTRKSISTALATFMAFIIFGIIPLLPYIVHQQISTFYFSILATAIALVLLGILRGKIANEKIHKAVLEVLILGSVSSALAYFVGTLFTI